MRHKLLMAAVAPISISMLLCGLLVQVAGEALLLFGRVIEDLADGLACFVGRCSDE